MALAVGLFYKTLNKDQGIVDNGLAVCNMSQKETRKLIKGRETDRKENKGQSIVFSDYGQYGETLGFYQNPYQTGERDPFNGKTVFLYNMCTDEDSSYLMGVDLDMKIPLEYLEDGFYELELLNGLVRSRLTSENVIDDQVHTITRNGVSKTIRILSDKTLFDNDTEKILEENVLYLEVKSNQEKPKDVYDIVLDPSGLTLYEDGSVNYGSQFNGLVESKEMYDVALEVKALLEEKGLSVLIARDDKTAINVFGDKGRIAKGYDAQAKYYIQLNLLYSGYKSDKGATMLYSNFASNRLASSIMKSLNAKTSLLPSNFSSGNNMDGVYQTRMVEGMDFMNIIRETGGKFTSSGIKEEFSELMGFSKDYRKGMQIVVIEYGYLNDDQTFNTWINEKDAIIKATYEGIIQGLGIE